MSKYFIEPESMNEETLLEKASREEYARRAFKKKYNFEPDKDSKDKSSGTITVDGEKHKVDLGKSKTVKVKSMLTSENGERSSSDCRR